MSLIHNEKAKLSATYINGLAITIFAVGGLAFAVGGLAPLFSSLYSGTPAPLPAWAIAAISTVCFLGSAALHFVARSILDRMKE